MTCFKTYVGIGSGADLLSGSCRTKLMTSSTDSGQNSRSTDPAGTSVNVGDGPLLVEARTLATLSAKTVDRLHVDGRRHGDPTTAK